MATLARIRGTAFVDEVRKSKASDLSLGALCAFARVIRCG